MMDNESANYYGRNNVNDHDKPDHIKEEMVTRERRDDRDNRDRRDRPRDERRRSVDRHDRRRSGERHERRRSGDRQDKRSGDKDVKREKDDKHDRRHREDRDKGRSHRSRSGGRKKEPSVDFRQSYKYWDVPPVGYESIAPAEFKAMQAAGQVMPTMYTTENSAYAINGDAHMSMGTAVSRQNRRIYVGNIPLGISEQGMQDFFNEHLKRTATVEGDPVIAVQINADKNFAFLECRSVDETNQALAMDGIMYQGLPLKLKRPRDYVAMPAEFMGVVSGIVQDTPHKLFVGGLPHYLNEEQVKELLVNFGELSGFNLVKDPTTGLSKGYAFCEYADHSVTDQACAGLTGIQVGEKRIVVQRASLGNKNPTQMPSLAMARPMALPMGQGMVPGGQETEILCLHNMITAEDLVDDDEYEEIVEDITDECSKYGRVRSVQIPRPSGHGNDCEGVGKVYVEFHNKEDTGKAMKALAGRTFSGRVVVASFYSPEKYRNGFF